MAGTLMGAAVLGAISHGLTRYVPLLHLAESTSADLRVAFMTPPMQQAKDIVVVGITDETLSHLQYRSPIDRAFLADLIDRLQQKGARLIVLDILLDQPTEAEKDDKLREVLLRHADTMVVAGADETDGLSARQASFLERYLAGLDQGLVRVYLDPSNDVVRSVPLRDDQGSGPQVGMAARVAERVGAGLPPEQRLVLDYRGRPAQGLQPFRVYPAHAVSLLPDAWLRDRIVLVGADLALEDRHRTPFALRGTAREGWLPGVLVQAHALSQLLERRTSRAASARLSLLLTVSCAIVGALLARLVPGPLSITATTFGALVVIWAGAFGLYRAGGALLPVVAPTLAVVLAAAAVSAARWRNEFVQRRFLKGAFSRYMAPALVDQLVEDPSRLRLSGERRELSFVFTDMAGYTSATRSMDPADMVRLVNEYLDGAFDVIHRHGGMVEKVVGDALHIMFNAPLDQPDHAQRAVGCAVELDRYFERFATARRNDGLEFGHTRIGVNTGTVVVGNMGGNSRFDYSATGDAVNIAARLESANRYLGTRICVGAATAVRCVNVQFRPVAELVLKGFQEPLQVFEPIDADRIAPEDVRVYLEAYRSLASGNAKAGAGFLKLADRLPEDPVVAFHRRRIDQGHFDVRMVLSEG